jgi:hypothetical protein
VHLVLAQPTLKSRQGAAGRRITRTDQVRLLGHLPDPWHLPAAAEVVQIPVNRHYALVAIYLTRHQALERVFQQRGWVRARLAPALLQRDRWRRRGS